jgi:hypothetical protein
MSSERGNKETPQAGRIRRRALKAPAQVFVAAAVIAAFAAGPASGTEANYQCSFCATENGPNQSQVRYNEVVDYTYNNVCDTLWKNNGGGNYNSVGHECIGFYTTAVCTDAGTVPGHGEVYNIESGAHQAGHQDNYSC